MRNISSKKNPIYKRFKKISQNDNSARKSTLYYCEGVTRFLAYKEKINLIDAILVDHELLSNQAVKQQIDAANSLNIFVGLVPRGLLDAISYRKKSSGVCFLAEKEYEIAEPSTFKEGLSLALHKFQDPGNIGTTIRTANWFGIKNIVLIDCINTAFHKNSQIAAMDSFPYAYLFAATEDEFVELVRSDPETFLLSVVPESQSTQLLEENNLDLKRKNCCLVLGNEREGISNQIVEVARNFVSIRKYGNIDSLNVAIAGAVIMSDIITRSEEGGTVYNERKNERI